MNDRENDAEFGTQFEQQPQKRNRINSSRNRYTDAVSWTNQFLFSDLRQQPLGQFVHPNMVQPERSEG